MKKKPTKAERLAVSKKQLQKTLNITGFTRSKKKYGTKSFSVPFPDLSTPQISAKLSNSFANPTGKKQLHPDAKQFPVGNSHKQGLELVYSKDYAVWMNGKKT